MGQRQHHLQSTLRRRPELSQHFLRREAAEAIARRVSRQHRLILEPGAGTGTLTATLADLGFHVIAIEKDASLHRTLRSRMIGKTNVECHRADILDWPLPREPYAIVSNVPFGITAELLRKLLDTDRRPDEALLVVQREAAERFTGKPRETRASLQRKPWFDMRIEACLRRVDFTPAPSVDCVLLRIERREPPLLPIRLRGDWQRFVNSGFGARRQAARDSLRMLFTETQFVRLARDFGFARDARPSEIGVEAWLGMFRFHAHGRLGPGERFYLNMSFSAGRRSSAIEASSDGVYSAPRMIATGTRASLPCTSSAAPASSSTTAICVTRIS